MTAATAITAPGLAGPATAARPRIGREWTLALPLAAFFAVFFVTPLLLLVAPTRQVVDLLLKLML